MDRKDTPREPEIPTTGFKTPDPDDKHQDVHVEDKTPRILRTTNRKAHRPTALSRSGGTVA